MARKDRNRLVLSCRTLKRNPEPVFPQLVNLSQEELLGIIFRLVRTAATPKEEIHNRGPVLFAKTIESRFGGGIVALLNRVDDECPLRRGKAAGIWLIIHRMVTNCGNDGSPLRLGKINIQEVHHKTFTIINFRPFRNILRFFVRSGQDHTNYLVICNLAESIWFVPGNRQAFRLTGWPRSFRPTLDMASSMTDGRLTPMPSAMRSISSIVGFRRSRSTRLSMDSETPHRWETA